MPSGSDPRIKPQQASQPAQPGGKARAKGPPKPPPSNRRLEVSDGAISDGRVSSPELDLAEVEAAMSALEGRHPEFAKAEREKAEAMAKRRRELEVAETRARKQSRRRAIIGGAIAIVVGGAGFIARDRYDRGTRALATSAALAKSFAPLGFTEVLPSPWDHPDRLEVPLTAGTCAIALGASGGKPATIEVTHDGDTLEAQGSFGFCTCANETVRVVAKATSGETSVRLLKTDARVFGSVLGFTRAAIKPASVDQCACMEDHLDAWLGGAASSLVMPPDPTYAKDGAAREAVLRAGLTPVQSLPGTLGLVPLAVPADACIVAASADPQGTLALRAPGGAKPLEPARGPIAVCSHSARAFGVLYEGKGAVNVFRADAKQLGGRNGVAPATLRAGLGVARVHVESDDLAWDARLALRSAFVVGVSENEVALTARLPAEARIVAFSLSPGAKLEPTVSAVSGDDFACQAPTPSSWLCASSAAPMWRESPTTAKVGVAFADLPLWMKTVASAPPRELHRVVLGLVDLGRKLGPQRFEPTVLEAVTEASFGASVLGRADEDAVVAVTLQPSPPYALPLSDGPSWSLDGEPVVVPLGPGRRIALRSRVAPSGADDARRTIVFRRAANAAKK